MPVVMRVRQTVLQVLTMFTSAHRGVQDPICTLPKYNDVDIDQ